MDTGRCKRGHEFVMTTPPNTQYGVGNPPETLQVSDAYMKELFYKMLTCEECKKMEEIK
jgi:hypothetical protein